MPPDTYAPPARPPAPPPALSFAAQLARHLPASGPGSPRWKPDARRPAGGYWAFRPDAADPATVWRWHADPAKAAGGRFRPLPRKATGRRSPSFGSPPPNVPARHRADPHAASPVAVAATADAVAAVAAALPPDAAEAVWAFAFGVLPELPADAAAAVRRWYTAACLAEVLGLAVAAAEGGAR